MGSEISATDMVEQSMFSVIKKSINKIIPVFFNDELGKFKKDKIKNIFTSIL